MSRVLPQSGLEDAGARPAAKPNLAAILRAWRSVHFVQALTKAAFRYDHFDVVRVVALGEAGFRAAFVAGHLRKP